jgi:hypothetical protein
MPSQRPIEAVWRGNFARFAQKPDTGGPLPLLARRRRSFNLRAWHAKVTIVGYWMAQNVYLHEMRAYIRAGELGLILRPV